MKQTTDFWKEPTLSNKRFVFAQWFGTNANTTSSYKDKMKLYSLICYLTQVMKKKNPVKYKSTLDVLNAIYNKDFEQEESNGYNNYIIGLSIMCDDFLYGTTDQLEKPENVKTPADVVILIKQLIEQWLPF